mgnify:CR=1 FL=1
MNVQKITEIARAISSASQSLKDMRSQRAMLGTGKGACAGIYVEVAFDGHGKQGFKLDDGSCSRSRLMASKDMMALALCKAWDAMIEEKERELVKLSAELTELTAEGI